MAAAYSSSRIVTIDDSKFRYNGSWNSSGQNDGELQGTRSTTTRKGATATINFTGSYIEIYGTIEPPDNNGPPSSKYDIDGTFTNTFQAPSVPAAMHTQRYYSSPPQLKDGPHQLVISSLKDGPLLSLDFAQYMPSSQELSSAALSSSSHSSYTPASRAGAIAAGVIGGVAFLIVMVLLTFLIRHRRQSSGQFTIEDGEEDPVRTVDIGKSGSHITPFRHAQSGPPVAWSSKAGNANLPTTRPNRNSGLSIQPPEYDQVVGEHLGHHPLTPQPNVHGQQKFSDPHVYDAEAFEVLPISR